MNRAMIEGILEWDQWDIGTKKYKDFYLMPNPYYYKLRSYNEYLYGHVIKSDRVEFSEINLRGILRDLSKEFWICLLRQNRSLALSLSEKYDVQMIWLSLTVEDWKFAIPWREAFINKTVEEFAKHDLFCQGLLKALPDFFRGKSINGWQKILKYRPEWVIYMDEEKWNDFNKEDFECLLKSDFFTSDKIQSYQEVLCRYFWLNCLSKAPSSVNFCEKNNGWGKLSNYNLCNLIIKQPSIVDDCMRHIKWEKMDMECWRILMETNVNGLNLLVLFDRYDVWNKLEERDWIDLLCLNAEYLSYCDKYDGWRLLSESGWMSLLDKNQRFIEKYRKICMSKESNEEILNKVKSYIEKRDRSIRRSSYLDDYVADWAEESGWNDVYGGGCEPSDFIDYD